MDTCRNEQSGECGIPGASNAVVQCIRMYVLTQTYVHMYNIVID